MSMMKGEKIFSYSKHPFELQSFSLIMKVETDQIERKTTYIYLGIRPVILVISINTNYSIGMELKLWKFSLAFNLSLWS
jgi:hypothetical protein